METKNNNAFRDGAGTNSLKNILINFTNVSAHWFRP